MLFYKSEWTCVGICCPSFQAFLFGSPYLGSLWETNSSLRWYCWIPHYALAPGIKVLSDWSSKLPNAVRDAGMYLPPCCVKAFGTVGLEAPWECCCSSRPHLGRIVSKKAKGGSKQGRRIEIAESRLSGLFFSGPQQLRTEDGSSCYCPSSAVVTAGWIGIAELHNNVKEISNSNS